MLRAALLLAGAAAVSSDSCATAAEARSLSPVASDSVMGAILEPDDKRKVELSEDDTRRLEERKKETIKEMEEEHAKNWFLLPGEVLSYGEAELKKRQDSEIEAKKERIFAAKDFEMMRDAIKPVADVPLGERYSGEQGVEKPRRADEIFPDSEKPHKGWLASMLLPSSGKDLTPTDRDDWPGDLAADAHLGSDNASAPVEVVGEELFYKASAEEDDSEAPPGAESEEDNFDFHAEIDALRQEILDGKTRYQEYRWWNVPEIQKKIAVISVKGEKQVKGEKDDNSEQLFADMTEEIIQDEAKAGSSKTAERLRETQKMSNFYAEEANNRFLGEQGKNILREYNVHHGLELVRFAEFSSASGEEYARLKMDHPKDLATVQKGMNEFVIKYQDEHQFKNRRGKLVDPVAQIMEMNPDAWEIDKNGRKVLKLEWQEKEEIGEDGEVVIKKVKFGEDREAMKEYFDDARKEEEEKIAKEKIRLLKPRSSEQFDYIWEQAGLNVYGTPAELRKGCGAVWAGRPGQYGALQKLLDSKITGALKKAQAKADKLFREAEEAADAEAAAAAGTKTDLASRNARLAHAMHEQMNYLEDRTGMVFHSDPDLMSSTNRGEGTYEWISSKLASLGFEPTTETRPGELADLAKAESAPPSNLFGRLYSGVRYAAGRVADRVGSLTAGDPEDYGGNETRNTPDEEGDEDKGPMGRLAAGAARAARAARAVREAVTRAPTDSHDPDFADLNEVLDRADDREDDEETSSRSEEDEVDPYDDPFDGDADDGRPSPAPAPEADEADDPEDDEAEDAFDKWGRDD